MSDISSDDKPVTLKKSVKQALTVRELIVELVKFSDMDATVTCSILNCAAQEVTSVEELEDGTVLISA